MCEESPCRREYFINNANSLKNRTAASLTSGPISLAQALEDATVDLTPLQNSIALINTNIGSFTITQFTTLQNSANALPTTYVAKSLFDTTIAAYQLQIGNSNKLPYDLLL